MNCDCVIIVGGFFSRLFSGLWGSKELRILILGLDGAGKTTILYSLQVGEVVSTIPSESNIERGLVLKLDYCGFLNLATLYQKS